jgi:hypothetical protein
MAQMKGVSGENKERRERLRQIEQTVTERGGAELHNGINAHQK